MARQKKQEGEREKKEPTNFKTRGQSKEFYMSRAYYDYIKGMAEMETLVALKFSDKEKLDKLKEKAEPFIKSTSDELYNHIRKEEHSESIQSELVDIINETYGNITNTENDAK